MQQKRKKTGGRGRVQAYPLTRENPSGGPQLIVNNCLRYQHEAGYEYPRTPDSCRGCMYAYYPELYDSGCKQPGGYIPREDTPITGRTHGGATGPGVRSKKPDSSRGNFFKDAPPGET